MDMALTWRDDPKLSSSGTIADVGSHALIQFDGSLVRMSFGASAC